MYPPRLHPGQQSAGPFDSHSSLNIGGLLRCVASTVHMDRIASKENKLSSGLKYKIDNLDSYHIVTHKTKRVTYHFIN